MALTFQQLLEKVKREIKTVSTAEVQKDLDQGNNVLIIDVREHDEFLNGHIPNAIFIPRSFLEMRIENSVPDHSQKIYLYCSGGNRSVLAVRSLQEMGYSNVLWMDGGFSQWTREERPVELPRETESDDF